MESRTRVGFVQPSLFRCIRLGASFGRLSSARSSFACSLVCVVCAQLWPLRCCSAAYGSDLHLVGALEPTRTTVVCAQLAMTVLPCCNRLSLASCRRAGACAYDCFRFEAGSRLLVVYDSQSCWSLWNVHRVIRDGDVSFRPSSRRWPGADVASPTFWIRGFVISAVIMLGSCEGWLEPSACRGIWLICLSGPAVSSPLSGIPSPTRFPTF